jgi:hypothetical protein
MGGNGGVGGAVPPPEDCPDKAEDAECDFLEDCGCADEAMHCQARGADAKPTCVKRGKKELGERCEKPDDCREGTCDQKVCRAYCEDSCDGGRCLHATDASGKAIDKLNVCWQACQVERAQSCSEGLSCRVLEIEGSKGAFCTAPLNPCPTVEDGKCDEPDICATGTDAFDCSCTKPEGQSCDPVSQCGCNKKRGDTCRFDNKGKAGCGVPGKLSVDEICKEYSDCGPGLGCTFLVRGTCTKYCRENADCPGKTDTCIQVTDDARDIPGYRVCRTGCGDVMQCPEHHECVEPDRDSPYCVAYEPELPGAQCNLTYNLGCETQPGTSCALDGVSKTAVCSSKAGSGQDRDLCRSNTDCAAGFGCLSHRCTAFCDRKSALTFCDDPAAVCEPWDKESSLGMCLRPCNSDPECGAQGKCSDIGLEDGNKICTHVPYSMCPANLVGDSVCDEPTGSGLCAAGTDTADCMGMSQ